ncbi:hypothetical protein ACH3XW_10225 [Acanthocheilonema viteae]|uniref:Uncharacterized protein n=1 Tax=Acanthocheilonema viteae TaxID=6277 RepID=A0A498SV27_ACAVI|nr:unnamed protein product [Acanthocheilonema viteae]
MNGPMLNFIIFCTLSEIISAITFSSFNSNTAGANSLNSNANIFRGGAAGGTSQPNLLGFLRNQFGGFGFGNTFSPFGRGFGFFPFGRGFGFPPFGRGFGISPFGRGFGFPPFRRRFGRK